jgi:hypothetical protein
MSQLIKKNGITVGEISVKKNYLKDKTALVFKVFHCGIGSEEDHFVFYENPEQDDWFVCLPESLVSQINTNRGLVIDVYSNFKSSIPLNIQDFTDELLEHNFHVFEQSHKEARRKNRLTLKKIFSKIINWKR